MKKIVSVKLSVLQNDNLQKLYIYNYNLNLIIMSANNYLYTYLMILKSELFTIHKL